MPARIAALLHTVRILLGFGRHLAETATHRSASPDFNAIAACFGTGRLYAILAHLQRGILRATALERVLLARAARGRDIGFVAPRERATTTCRDPPSRQPSRSAGRAASRAAGGATGRGARRTQSAARPSRPAGWNDPELFMPTLEELEAQVRRRPLGRTLVEICLDLAVVPGFCTGAFWNELFDSIRLHGGSVAALMQEKVRREKAFSQEQDRKLGSNWDWLEMGREALRRVLGFFIGEAADAPFDPLPEPYPRPRRWPPARPEPTAHIEAKFAHGTGSWPAPPFRFGLAHACGRTTRLRQHAFTCWCRRNCHPPIRDDERIVCTCRRDGDLFCKWVLWPFRLSHASSTVAALPDEPAGSPAGPDPQQDAPGDESQQAPEGECQQAPADECQKAQDVRPSQLHCRTCRLISSYRLGAHYTLRPVTHGPASLKRGISNSTYGAIRSHFASQQTIGCAGKWRASTPPGTEGQSDAGRPRRLRQHASRQNPVHLFVDRPAQHANRCRDAHSPCTMRPSAIAPMRGRGSPGRRPVRHAAKEARLNADAEGMHAKHANGPRSRTVPHGGHRASAPGGPRQCGSPCPIGAFCVRRLASA